MPDSKITALTSISTSTDPANDPLVIVDVSDTSMAASGTTKKVTVNQILGAGGTATLASATITGDLTVDTNVLKVDSANNRVGIGTASPGKRCEINQSANAIITIGAGEILRLIGDDGNTIGRITEIGFGTGPTSAVYAPVTLGAINTSNAGYNHKAFYIATRTGTADDAPIERYRIANDGVATWSNVGGVAGTAMTLNATGLGVGVASPAQKLDVAGSIYISNNAAYLYGKTSGGLATRTFGINAANDVYVGSIDQSINNIRFNSGGTDRLLIDTSGNVGIGVTPKSWASGYRALQLGIYSALTDAAGGATYLTNNAYFDSVDSRWEYITNNRVVRYDQDTADGGHKWYSAVAGAVNAAIAWGNPLMTLDASGNLLVGTTTNGGNGVSIRPSTASPNVVLVGSDTSGGTAWQLYSTGTSSNRFYVTWAGVVNAVNTTISGISDARLKENVQDIDVGLGAILALKPRKFDWKAGKGKDIKGDRGFIAQEFEQVFPQLVDEWADPAPEGEAPYKSVRQDLIPVLVKAIQELTARVQTLETR